MEVHALTNRGGRLALAVAAMAVAATALPAAASADTLTVTRTDDPPPGGCAPTDCSLREAMLLADGSPGSDLILIPPGTYTLTIPGNGDVTVGDLDVTHNVDIKNTGTAPVIINANGAVTGSRAFDVESETLSLFGITVEGGIAPVANPNGGGIYVQSNLYLWDSRVAGNSLPGTNGNQGGGIYNAGHTVITRTELAGNTADGGFGGGIYTAQNGLTEIRDSKFFDNHAEFGGALSSDGTNGNVTVERSNFSYNQAQDLGGADYQLGPSTYSFTNSTLNDNTSGAGSGGGAIRVRDAQVSLKSSTVTLNSAANAGGIAAQDDGQNTTSVTLADTIVAGNIDSDHTDGDNPDCYDPDAITGTHFVTQGYNVIGNVEGCLLTPVTGDQFGTSVSPVDAGLSPSPAFYGGPFVRAFTDPLLPGSTAVNAGDPDPEDGSAGNCPIYDARGVPRSTGGRCDVGAYELVRCQGTVVNRVGTAGQDVSSSKGPNPTMAPTTGDDGMEGYAGDDKLRGRGGRDALCGGGGGDTLNGGADGDTLAGGPGPDHLRGGPGHDVCIGGPGQDTARGCEVKRQIP